MPTRIAKVCSPCCLPYLPPCICPPGPLGRGWACDVCCAVTGNQFAALHFPATHAAACCAYSLRCGCRSFRTFHVRRVRTSTLEKRPAFPAANQLEKVIMNVFRKRTRWKPAGRLPLPAVPPPHILAYFPCPQSYRRTWPNASLKHTLW